MNFEETLEESLDGLWNNRQYGGTNELPRKDYQPYSSSQGYSFPYQKGSPPVFPPTAPEPEKIPSIPWPLDTVTSDLADSFVYLFSAYKKMQRCVNENPSLNKRQKLAIKVLMKLTKTSLIGIKKVGSNILNFANLVEIDAKQNPNIF